MMTAEGKVSKGEPARLLCICLGRFSNNSHPQLCAPS